jgi:hypothetical protein
MESVRFPFDHGTPAASARQVARGAIEAWKAAHLLEDALVVVTELVENVTRHTTNGGELVLTLQEDVVLVEVVDASPDLPTLRSPDLRRPDGRGMLIVAGMARTWGSRSTSWSGHAGKVVWAELDRRPTR